jgi:hypothetical protein
MTTPCRHAFVSIAATLTMTLSLAACVSAPSRPVLDQPTATGTGLLSIRFENSNRESVDVYLIGAKREWLLGRVATGAIATLRLPDEALAERSMVQLAVLAGQHPTFAVAREPRAVLSAAQPPAAMLAQRWTFSRGNLMSLRY